MGQIGPETRKALLRLYNGYHIHARSFQALRDRGFAEPHNGTEQRITDAGRALLDLPPTI